MGHFRALVSGVQERIGKRRDMNICRPAAKPRKWKGRREGKIFADFECTIRYPHHLRFAGSVLEEGAIWSFIDRRMKA
jgi:hypothetical protein